MVSGIFLCGDYVTIYVDVLVILNTLVNYFMLLAVRKLSRSQSSRWQLCFGAAVGGLSSLLIFLDNLGFITTILKILTGVLMVALTFGVIPLKLFLKRIFWVFAICAVFGGVTFALYMLFDWDTLIYSNGIIYFDINLTFLVVCTVFSYIVLTIIFKLTDKKAPQSKEYYTTIQNEGRTFSAIALMDTGNNLREPFSGYPVIMLEKRKFAQLYGNAEGKIRLIPVNTVNGESLIRAFRPDFITVNGNNIDKVYVGESLTNLCEYEIILNINIEGELRND